MGEQHALSMGAMGLGTGSITNEVLAVVSEVDRLFAAEELTPPGIETEVAKTRDHRVPPRP